MPRVRKAPASRKRRKRWLKRAKGFVGGRRRLYRTARETVQRAMVFATRDRKQRKRHFRRLWTVRINAACRQSGTTYSRLIAGLKKSNINLDRKSLSELAVLDLAAFKQLVQVVNANKTKK